MAARSIWNGTLTFGTVAIPIKLFSATENRVISFKEVRESDGSRISHKRVGAETGEEIAYGDIDKGYDTGNGVLVLTKEEIAAADGPRPKVVDIELFVKGEDIDPVFYDKAYHVGANKGGEHAYRVLLAALEKSGRVGIGRFVMRSREQLIALRPIQGALGLQTMRFADELVDPDDLELPEMKKKPGEKEVKMAGALVQMLEAEWEPEEHHDTYRTAVMDLIEAKSQGKELTVAKEKESSGDDLMAALEASLAAVRDADSAGAAKTKGGGTEPTDEAVAKTAAKKKTSGAPSRTSAAKAKGTSTPKRAPTKKPTGPSKAKAKKDEDA
ncbi:MAG: Ku protein [Solirubrobacteraceae bacterium]|nr:Ku protein [Solirubrobacteraceae bacterium]